jgi:5'-nucleotidase / UDP-sugar diphosphatase
LKRSLFLSRIFPVYFLLSFLAVFPPSFAREAKLTILFTNDHDGQIEPIHQDDLSKPVGGVTRRMALIGKITKEAGPDHVVLVDGGDLFLGTPLSESTHGEIDCAAYQLMKYDAIALGEHDFEYGQKTLSEYRKKFKTPWISANLVRGGQPFLKSYLLKYAGGIRVGLIGFSNPDTKTRIGREKTAGLVFNPPGASAKGLHSILKKEADIFVVLSRLGVEGDKKLAKDNAFLNVIIGGQSQTLLTEPLVTKTKDGNIVGPIIAQAGSRGLYLGRLDLTVNGHRDRKTKKAEYSIEDYHYQLIPITADLPEDPQMTALLKKYAGEGPPPAASPSPANQEKP